MPSTVFNQFVIVKAFYPLLLMVSHKLSVHFQLIELSNTLGGVIVSFEDHPLRVTVSWVI